MRDRKHMRRLVGETLREVGTLTFVLVPLDAAFTSAQVRGIDIAAAMLLGLLLIGWGILLET